MLVTSLYYAPLMLEESSHYAGIYAPFMLEKKLTSALTYIEIH